MALTTYDPTGTSIWTLPTALTPLIGRDHECTAIQQQILHTRLVTLIGPGGVGKTRLALQVAGALREQFADGVSLLELAGITDPRSLPTALATILKVRDLSEQGLVERVIAKLQPHQMLLVIDNCEHLIAACVPLIEALLGACPGLHILATSRERLRCASEYTWYVHPLALPSRTPLPSSEALLTYASIQLFLERARAVQPAFTLTESNVTAIVDICHRVDGIPLAIELAAARLTLLSPDQLAALLREGMRILTSGLRTASPRQQTLQATISWSYTLLPLEEQALLRRLALCAGSFDLSLVDALSADLHSQGVDLLGQLIDKSLVMVAGHQGETRYRLLETIRQFGREQADMEGERATTYECYARWVSMLAEQAGLALRGRDQVAWLARLDANIEHLHVILAWLLEERRSAQLVQITAALREFWERRGYAEEAQYRLESTLTDETLARDLRARALLTLGMLLGNRVRVDQAQPYVEQAQIIYHELSDPVGEALATQQQGYLAFWRQDYATAEAYYQRSLALLPEGASWMRALVLHRWGITITHLQGYQAAEQVLRECLSMRRALGDQAGVALTLANVSSLVLEMDRTAEAQALALESLEISHSLGDHDYILCALIILCQAAIIERQPDLVLAPLRKALTAPLLDVDVMTIEIFFAMLAYLAALRGQMPLAAQLMGFAGTLRQAGPLFSRNMVLEAGMRDIAHPEKLAQDHPADWEHGQMMTREQALASARQIFASSATIGAEPLRSRIIPPPRAATSIHILALGSAEVRRGDMSLTTADWTYLKAKELLMYLLNYRMRTKGQICLALWPDADPEQVRSYLRVVIYHLRRALGDASRIISTNNGYAFDYAQEYWYDVEEFEAGIAQATRQAANAPDHAIPLLEDACMLYRGAYLEDLPLREWIMQRQREIQQQYLDALVLLGQLYLNNDQPHRALETLQKVIAHDPYQEIAHRIIIKCYATLGERSQALRYYRELSNQLYQHLGAQPDPQTTALITCLLERD